MLLLQLLVQGPLNTVVHALTGCHTEEWVTLLGLDFSPPARVSSMDPSSIVPRLP